MTAMKDISNKHPVSGLMELATKRSWGPPNFVQVFECGPSHSKQYIFKVGNLKTLFSCELIHILELFWYMVPYKNSLIHKE